MLLPDLITTFIFKAMRIKQLFFLLLILISPLLYSSDTPTPSPRLIVHLLDYLALDYGAAVQDGKIMNTYEYAEQIEFINSALETAYTVPEIKTESNILSHLEELKKQILAKAASEKVSELCRHLQQEIIQKTKMEISPPQWPNRTKGAKLYSQTCTSCHGPNGKGDGPLALSLKPPPSNFFNEELMKDSSPFKVFNTIRLGIPGTAMTPFHQLSDQEVWDIAFYLLALRHEERAHKKILLTTNEISLTEVATSSDQQLRSMLSGNLEDKERKLLYLRLHVEINPSQQNLLIAKTYLKDAWTQYQKGNFESARKQALLAYLEGVEPVEPKLKANDPKIVPELEMRMALVRSSIEFKKSAQEILETVQSAEEALTSAEKLLTSTPASPWVTFILTLGIILREAFEALLIVIALLGVLRASGSKKAVHWVHGGWILAVVLGIVAWFLSGWLMMISGAGRELLEAATSLLAVFVLLYIGYWLHRQTQISRWKAFIENRIKKVLIGKNLIGLALISFIAVFREAFETVLFLRAIWLESGEGTKTAMLSGVAGSGILVCILAIALLKFSAKIPIRKLFQISSVILLSLAVILTGKGLHAFQETGLLSISHFPLSLRSDLLGFYPTFETLAAQVLILFVCIAFWIYENKTHA